MMILKYSKPLFFILAMSSCVFASEVEVSPGRYYGGDVVTVPVKHPEEASKSKMDILAEPESFERSRKLFRESKENNFQKMRARFNPDTFCAQEGNCR